MAADDGRSVGAVPTADIAVPEHAREIEFYSHVLTTGERPLWREDLMSSGGAPIIGLGARTPDHSDLPLQWMPHIQVADVAASAARATALGGRELRHQTDDGGESRWAVLLDPNGAAFGIIPAPADRSMESAPDGASGDSSGKVAWLDLTVPRAADTRDFYRDVVGWSVQDVAMEHEGEQYADYALCTPDGTAVAGVCHARGVNKLIPPVWLIYLPVGDLGASLRYVQEGGGEVVDAREDSTGACVFAVIRDPVGAYLALVPA